MGNTFHKVPSFLMYKWTTLQVQVQHLGMLGLNACTHHGTHAPASYRRRARMLTYASPRRRRCRPHTASCLSPAALRSPSQSPSTASQLRTYKVPILDMLAFFKFAKSNLQCVQRLAPGVNRVDGLAYWPPLGLLRRGDPP